MLSELSGFTGYLNGEYAPVNDLKISVLDRGFIFGDGVYEVIPIYSRKPFHLENHLIRLQNSLDGIRLSNPHTNSEWRDLIQKMINLHPWEDQYVYLQITRGVARRDHGFPKETTHTVFMMTNPWTAPAAELLTNGVAAVTAEDQRWLRCHLKTTALLANVLMRQYAIDHGAVEVILLRDGFMTEGSASNILGVKNGVLLAPPKDNLILPGITYDVILKLAEEEHIPLEIRNISENEVLNADELLLTSSTKEIMPITRLNDKPVANGKPGPIFHQLYKAYQLAKPY